ncbi:MAG: ATP-binding cassette domain-containing protein [Clostridiaceae bacterium]|jgi:putative ABC transport system ATP-binding protein|nr:ATP-binding cassette domain-containing protein [Eubacteriales bacterium]MDD4140430.1 ATP-binding cassette domain-containing protein [Eubacteriales bacterium]MDD4743709.1 ATP-binding cassette domain-containing protein [Eubacteriales bacterium]NLB45759.1 ATP-binding cassette domain-containing protein [Clostridiaceae bacterium]
MFELSDVTYKDILTIDHLRLEKGRVTCIVGESGSGKTTLLRLLNKLISCDRGTITYQGQDILDLDAVLLRRSVVMLPQNPAIYPGNVRDNLAIGLAFAEKLPASDERLRQALAQVNLNKDLDAKSDLLSGGEKQRLALARLMLLEPDVYLLDEPSSALDENTERLIIEALVAAAKDNGKTLIMVTHTRQIAQAYADRTIEISGGRIVSDREARS